MRHTISRLAFMLLAIVITVPLVRAANLSGSYTLTGTTDAVKFEAKASLAEALQSVAVANIQKLELNAGDFTDADWEWLKSQSTEMTALTDLTLASGLTSVATMPGVNNGYCPLQFSKLETVSIAKVTSVPESPFMKTGSLKEVSFPDATELQSFAFGGSGNSVAQDFSSLNTIRLPKISTIGFQAFAACTQLKKLVVGPTPPTVDGGEYWTEYIPADAELEIVNSDGTKLEDEALKKAKEAYLAVDDGNKNDKRWYAFALESEEYYQVMALGTEEGKGKVQAEPSGAIAVNTEVCLEITPADKFKVNTATIKAFKTGDESTTVDIDSKTRCFRMPAHNVTAKVEFIPNELKVAFIYDKEHGSTKWEYTGANMKEILDKLTSAKKVEILPAVETVEVLEGAFLANDYHEFYKLRFSVPQYLGNNWDNGFNHVRIFKVSDAVPNHQLHLDVNNSKLLPSIAEAHLPYLRKLGHSGLKEMRSLVKVELPQTQELGHESFANCVSLPEVNLPMVTKIGDESFRGCVSLLSASFPRVTEVKAGAFSGCKQLFNILAGSVPPRVVAGAFDDCPAVRLLIPVDADGKPLMGTEREKAVKAYDDENDGMIGDGMWYGWTLPKNDVYTVTVAADIEGGSVYAGKYGAEGQSVRIIVTPADGKGLKEVYYTVEGSTEKQTITNFEFTMPNGNVTIHATFEDSSFKVKVNDDKEGMGATLTEALKGAGFDGEEKLKEVKSIAIVGGSFHEANWIKLPTELYTNGTIGLSQLKEFSLTSTIDYLLPMPKFDPPHQYFKEAAVERANLEKITKVTDKAFAESMALQSIKLPEVVEIGASTFAGSKHLTDVQMPKMEKMGRSTFEGCTSLKEITLANITSAGDYTFKGCTSLTTPTMPKITLLGTETFAGCTSLSAADFPNVAGANVGAFAGCSMLTEVKLPMLPAVVEEMFSNCTALPSVELPAATVLETKAFAGAIALKTARLPKVTAVGQEAFMGCSSLTSVHLPKLTDIDQNAFAGCTALASIDLGAEPPARVAQGSFADCPSDRAINFVDENGSKLTGSELAAAIAAYQAADDGNTEDFFWYGWPLPQEGAYKVHISVAMNGNALKGALVKVMSTGSTPKLMGEGLTDAAGMFTIQLKSGKYTYTATEEHCKDKSGEFEVKDAEMKMDVPMEPQQVLPQHTITYAQPQNGVLTLSRDEKGVDMIATGSKLDEGTKVFLMAKPNEGYEVATITVAGKPIEVKPDAEGVCKTSFQMPTADAEVAAIMKAKQQSKPEPKPEPKPQPKPEPQPQQPKTDVESALLAGVAVGPNPCTDVLHVLEASQVSRYALLTLSGQVLQSGANSQSIIEIPMQSSPAGLYVLRLTANDGSVRVVRIVKM